MNNNLRYKFVNYIKKIGLIKFKEKYIETKNYEEWTEDYKTAKQKYDKILEESNFREGEDLSREQLDQMFRLLVNNFSHNQSLNVSLLNKNGINLFNHRLRDLYYDKGALSLRIDEFLNLDGVAEHTLSEFLVVLNFNKYPLSTNPMKEILNLDKEILDQARQLALEKYKVSNQSNFKNDTIEYLTYKTIYEEIKEILNLNNFYEINMILWRFGKENQLRVTIEKYKESYLERPEGKDHIHRLQEEKKLVNKIYSKIQKKKEEGKEFAELTINKLLPIKRESVTPAGIGSLTAYPGVEKKDFPEIADNLLNLINNLINNMSDEDKQKNVINEFVSSKYRRGIQQGILTPVLYCLDNYYLLINSKIRDTVNFISKEVFGDEISFSGLLEEYIDDNIILKEFLQRLTNINSIFKDFDVFSAYCHWMCVENLGGYAKDTSKFNRLQNKPFIEIEKPGIQIEKNHLDITGLHFKEKDKEILINRITTAIAKEKHIILIGPPGTGKSKLAKEICINYCGEKGYSMATATSDWSTFETIGGYMLNKQKELEFSPGIFLNCFQSEDNILRNKWLILDEINRTDIDKAFGSLFSALTGDNINLPFKYNLTSKEGKNFPAPSYVPRRKGKS